MYAQQQVRPGASGIAAGVPDLQTCTELANALLSSRCPAPRAPFSWRRLGRPGVPGLPLSAQGPPSDPSPSPPSCAPVRPGPAPPCPPTAGTCDALLCQHVVGSRAKPACERLAPDSFVVHLHCRDLHGDISAGHVHSPEQAAADQRHQLGCTVRLAAACGLRCVVPPAIAQP